MVLGCIHQANPIAMQCRVGTIAQQMYLSTPRPQKHQQDLVFIVLLCFISRREEAFKRIEHLECLAHHFHILLTNLAKW